MIETWGSVEGFSKYSVSSTGRVKNNSTKRILRSTTHKSGYLKIMLIGDEGTRKTLLVHRLVCLAFKKQCGIRDKVNHIDGIKTNNSNDNLEWVTSSENSRHYWDNNKRNRKRGEDAPNSKLTEVQVRVIKHSLRHLTAPEVCKIYGVSTKTVYRIRRGEGWEHVQ